MSPGPTFDRVYLALKERLTNGWFSPGDHLEPAAIGEDLNASVTPVRDALHRLVGQRLVETPRNEGFRVPMLTEAGLRDLYDWNRALLDAAARRLGANSRLPKGVTPADRIRSFAEAADLSVVDLFVRIARGTGSDEHEAAVRSLNDRLGAVRVAEERILEDLHIERTDFLHSLRAADLPAFRRSLAAYHRRRRRHVPDLLAAMMKQEPPA